MSFREIASDVKLCNRALSRIAQGASISSIEPPAPQGEAARQCALWYKATVARLLEMHHWNLATKQAPLTEVTNDRSNEWLYAYQKPVDMAFPVTLTLLSGQSADIQYYRGLQGLIGLLYGKSIFLVAGDILYTRVAGNFEYVSYDITEAEFNATFENLVIVSLASVIAMAVTKNKKLADALKTEAMNEINVAIAQNLNAGNPRYGNSPSERDIVRGASWGQPWDWFPGAA